MQNKIQEKHVFNKKKYNKKNTNMHTKHIFKFALYIR